MKKEKITLLLMLGVLAVSTLAAGCGGNETAIEAVSLETESLETESLEAAPSETEALETESLRSEADSEGAESLPEDSDFAGSEEEDAVPETADQNTVPVKGIYVTGPMAGTDNMDNLIALVDETELNALVIDVKNDEGYVVYEMDSPTVSEVGAVKRYVRNMPALIQKCKEKGIYLIARIVAFKDPLLAEAKPEWSLHLTDGSIFRDKSGLAWVNPYEEAVWDYLVEVALEAAELGFDEIQFDYIRFSTDSGMKNVDFGPGSLERSKEDVVADFTAYACDKLHAAGVAVSADVYGVVIDSEVDQQIVGQNYVEMSQSLDYICPMVYPSHYGPYNYDIPVPDAQPYDTVKAAMQSSKKVLAGMEITKETTGDAAEAERTNSEAVDGTDLTGSISGNTMSGNTVEPLAEDAVLADDAVLAEDGALTNNEAMTDEKIAALEPMEGIRAGVRPWLQDFTASWVSGHIEYGPQQIRDQIQAVYDAGYDEWILWNAANRYTREGLLPDEKLTQGEN